MFAARRKWVVVGARVVLALAVVLLVRTFGSNTGDNLELPGTDSQAATDLLAERFAPQQNGSSPIVFQLIRARSLTRRTAGDRGFPPGDREAAARCERDRPVQPARCLAEQQGQGDAIGELTVQRATTTPTAPDPL
jgi:uncharacterized membrane protein YdfJ with MMPL/SSD domain